MNFLNSRAEQVAEHIRKGILERRWKEPLPNTRDWARQLGISRPTLLLALHYLEKRGMLQINQRDGIRLRCLTPKYQHQQKTVRILCNGSNDTDLSSWVWVWPLSEQLQTHQIQLCLEKCSYERLRLLCLEGKKNGRRSNELYLPCSFPAKFQRMFVTSRKPALFLGYPEKGLNIPYVTCDLVGAVRHAAHHLLRRGFAKVTLLVERGHAPWIEQIQQAFIAACAEWPQQPILPEVVLVPLPLEEQRIKIRRFVAYMKTRQGILMLHPLSVGLLITNLLAQGHSIPEKAQIGLIYSTPENINVDPTPFHYPFPLRIFVKTISHAAVHFFKTGFVPHIQKILPLEMAD